MKEMLPYIFIENMAVMLFMHTGSFCSEESQRSISWVPISYIRVFSQWNNGYIFLSGVGIPLLILPCFPVFSLS